MSENIGHRPDQVIVFDTTLRDGGQSPGVHFNIDDKVDIAEQLARLGVDVMETGFPAASQGDFEAVRAVAMAIKESVICGLTRTKPKDIERCWEAIEPAADNGGARIHTFIATSKIHMRDKLRMTPEEVVAATKDAVTRARQFTPDVEFSPEDASRSDFGFMMRVILGAVEAGATTINVPDTVGYAQPSEYAYRIAAVKQGIESRFGKGAVIISTHCHNDLGLAVANTLAGVMAGARQVEVTVNGIGERAGNASLECVVEALRNRPDFYISDGVPLGTNIRPSELIAASKIVSQRTGFPVAPNTPIVGANSFKHTSGIHQAGVLKNRSTYEWMDPDALGKSTEFVIGNLSGKAAIIGSAKKLGFDIDILDAPSVVSAVKTYADACGRPVSDVEIERIVAKETGVELAPDNFTIENIWFAESDQNCAARVIVTDVTGHVQQQHWTGKEPVDAVMSALRMITGDEFEFRGWQVVTQKSGSDVPGGVSLVVAKDGTEISSYAEGADIVRATAAAFVNGVNTIQRIHCK